MSSVRKQVKIVSLGEIVTPDIMKTIQAFTALIASKKEQANPVEIGKSIGFVLQQNMKLINDFKLGILNESDFTIQMIDSLKKTTGAELTIDEFDRAWNAMNPKLEQVEPLLKQAIEHNNYSPSQQVIFISFTNPKDIRHLASELEKSNIHYKIDSNQLVEIGGIPLFTTYNTKQTKAELIETTIKKLNTKPTQSALTNSISNVLSFEQAKEPEPIDIKYIRCVNGINDPILKDDLDKTNQEVEKKAAGFFVDTILWMKNERTLSDVLCDSQIESRIISAARL